MTEPVKPSVGQIWKENDDRLEPPRYVKVTVLVGECAVVLRVNVDGSAWPGARSTRAQVRRFNGKRGGYSLHKETVA